MNTVELESVHTYYGKAHILFGVDLYVAEGEIVTLLGRNGVGKTTTMRSIMGLTPPRQGQVRIFGQSVTRWSPHRIAQQGVGYVPEGRKIFPNLTVEENLAVPITRPGPWTVKRCYEAFSNLAERKKNLGRQLSGGEQEMLAIARALLINPRLLLLDEPSQGLAPLIVREIFSIVRDLQHEGVSILLVEQNAFAALSLANRAYVLDGGKVIYSGLASELAKDPTRVRSLAGARGGGA